MHLYVNTYLYKDFSSHVHLPCTLLGSYRRYTDTQFLLHRIYFAKPSLQLAFSGRSPFFCEVIPRACPRSWRQCDFPFALPLCVSAFLFYLAASFSFLSLLKWTSLSLGLSLYSASLHVLHKVLTSTQPGREGREGREAEALKHFRYTTQDVNKAL